MEDGWGDVDFSHFNANALSRSRGLLSADGKTSRVSSQQGSSAQADDSRRTRGRIAPDGNLTAAQTKQLSPAQHFTRQRATEISAVKSDMNLRCRGNIDQSRSKVKSNDRSTLLRQRLNDTTRTTQRLAVIYKDPNHITPRKDVEKEDTMLDGLDVPANFRLRLIKPTTSSRAEHTMGFESDDDFGEQSMGGRHISSRRARSTRMSTGSSSLSISMASTDDDDPLEGLEVPVGDTDLRRRFRATKDARAAGDTIRLTRQKYVEENPLEGLTFDDTDFTKVGHANVRKSPNATIRVSRLSPASKRSVQDLTKKAPPRTGARHDSQSRSEAAATRKTSRSSLTETRALERKASRTNLRSLDQAAELSNRQRVRSQNTEPKPAFVPGGSATANKSHHVSAIQNRSARADADAKSSPRTSTRTTPSPSKRRATASEALRAEAAKQNTYTHSRAKTYGEGHELDDIDDLPDLISSPRDYTKTVRKSASDAKLNTYAERRHRQEPGMKTSSSMASLRQPASKEERSRLSGTTQRKLKPQLPLLIANLGATMQKKSVKEMHYNPETFRWEGNDEDMAAFDATLSSPPRPALISNISHAKGVLVSKGMVFDPEQMCWVKLQDESDTEDPFDGLLDLEEAESVAPTSAPKSSGNHGDFTVGEEFDVGPSFIRRQREEERTWKAYMSGWTQQVSPQERHAQLFEIYRLVMDD